MLSRMNSSLSYVYLNYMRTFMKCNRLIIKICLSVCAAGFALLNLPKGKSLGRCKPETNSYAQAHATHCVGFLLYPSSAELPNAK